MKIVILLLLIIGVLVAGGALFLLNSNTEKIQKEEIGVIEGQAETNGEIVLPNQGNTMEGHTPRGFQGMGTGLFAGDNLNQSFPEGDGVQIYITFDIEEIAEKDITSAVVRSEHAHVNGSPFDLGFLRIEPVRYDSFSSALWNLEAEEGLACVFAEASEGPYACDVTEAVKRSLSDGYPYAQFRLLFDEAGDGDGKQDLLMFYITDSNTNEPGIFELVIE